MAVAELGSMDAQALSGSLCPAEPVRVHASSRNIARLFLILLAAFAALFLLSWPIVFSLNLWVFNDRGNLLNLDYLLSEGLRPGVDTFYSYGLLPVALQHAAFVFGRGYWPMIGCTIIALVTMAFIWAVLLRRLPRSPLWLAAVLCVVPMLLWVNPNFPYSLALLSMLSALALAMERRLDLALAASAVGCWSVPSLPLVLTALLLLLIFLDWWHSRERSLAALLRTVTPGAACYLAIGIALASFFGWRPVIATALPFQGASFYATKGYGLASLHEFLSPKDVGLRWYLFTRSGWWMVSTAMLFACGAFSAARLLRSRAFDGPSVVVLVLALLHGAFVFYATGPQAQHIVYDPLLAGGVLLGLAGVPRRTLRNALLALFACLALLGNFWQARDTWRAWRDQRVLPVTAGLYASPAFAAAWAHVLDASTAHSLLLLTYPTGVHHYFPTVHSPKIWFLEVGQLLPADEDRVLAQMAASDIIVTYPVSPYVERDARMRHHLAAMCLAERNSFFVVWRRRNLQVEKNCASAGSPGHETNGPGTFLQ